MNLSDHATARDRAPLDLTRPAALREQACSAAFSDWLLAASAANLAEMALGLEIMAIQIRSEELRRAQRHDPIWADDPYPRGMARGMDANLLEDVA